MRAVQYDEFGAMPHLAVVPDPHAPAGGIVVAVRATGLCRSDWHGWQGHDSDIRTLPHTPGHEFAGTVVEVGDGVRSCASGDRITVPFVCACGTCPTCASGSAQVCPNQWQPGFHGPGSFAEYVAIPFADANVVHLPDDVTDVTAAALGCRVATAYRAVAQVGCVQPGEVVAVLGCGGVGLSAVMIAAALGARVIAVDVHEPALRAALTLGAETTIHASPGDDIAASLRDLTDGGVDVGIDALGSIQTAAASVSALRPRGRHVQVGLLPPKETLGRESVPMHLVVARELQILGSHGMAAADYPPMIAQVLDGSLRPDLLVARVIALDDVPLALSELGASRQAGVTVCENAAAR